MHYIIRLGIGLESNLPPWIRTYGKSQPFRLAQAQVFGFEQYPLQSHPDAFGGSVRLLRT